MIFTSINLYGTNFRVNSWNYDYNIHSLYPPYFYGEETGTQPCWLDNIILDFNSFLGCNSIAYFGRQQRENQAGYFRRNQQQSTPTHL